MTDHFHYIPFCGMKSEVDFETELPKFLEVLDISRETQP